MPSQCQLCIVWHAERDQDQGHPLEIRKGPTLFPSTKMTHAVQGSPHNACIRLVVIKNSSSEDQFSGSCSAKKKQKIPRWQSGEKKVRRRRTQPRIVVHRWCSRNDEILTILCPRNPRYCACAVGPESCHNFLCQHQHNLLVLTDDVSTRTILLETSSVKTKNVLVLRGRKLCHSYPARENIFSSESFLYAQNKPVE